MITPIYNAGPCNARLVPFICNSIHRVDVGLVVLKPGFSLSITFKKYLIFLLHIYIYRGNMERYHVTAFYIQGLWYYISCLIVQIVLYIYIIGQCIHMD